MTNQQRKWQRNAKRHASRDFKMEKMSPEVYQLRRKVIECLYTIKKRYPNIPRQVVRIVSRTEKQEGQNKRVAAYAGVSSNYIHVCDEWAGSDRILQLTAHELVHAVTGFGHDDNCPLMAPVLRREVYSEEKVLNLLEKYLKRYK